MARRKQAAEAAQQPHGSDPQGGQDPQQPPMAEREPGDEPERVKLPNPFGWITDVSAGVQYRTARDPYQAEILFKDGKPSDEVRQIMKDAGFRWNPEYEAWTRPIGYRTAAQDRLTGERTANAVMQKIREEKGIEASQEQGHDMF